MIELLDLIIERLSLIDEKIILNLYKCKNKKSRYTELYEKIGGSKDNFNKRIKILERENIIKVIKLSRKNVFCNLTNFGEEIACKIIEKEREKEEYLIKKFRKELKLIFSLDYLSFPFKFELKCLFKFNPYETLKNYITLIYIKICKEKISISKNEERKLIEYINKIWKEEENEKLKFYYKKAIEEVIEDINEKIEKSNGIKKENLILTKEIIEKNKERLFKDFYEYSKNPILWKIGRIKTFSRIFNIFIGAIAGVISSLVTFLVIYILLSLIITLLLPIITFPEIIIIRNLVQLISSTFLIIVIIGVVIGIAYSLLYKIIPGKNSKIKGIIFSLLILLCILSLLFIMNLINILFILLLLSITCINGYILGFLWDILKEKFSYLKTKILNLFIKTT
ncbi:MAG: hypothetical protein QXY18_02610 [Nitrososphaerota archaeon]